MNTIIVLTFLYFIPLISLLIIVKLLFSETTIKDEVDKAKFLIGFSIIPFFNLIVLTLILVMAFFDMFTEKVFYKYFYNKK